MSYVYIVEHPDSKYKIGRSKNPERRLFEMNTGTPEDLELHSKIEVGISASSVENEIQNALSEYHITGEWYDVCEDTLLSVIDDVLSDGHNIEPYSDTVEYSPTHIYVPESDFKQLKQDKPDGVTWGYYLTEMRTVE